MTHPSLRFLPFVPVEQKGWLTLSFAEREPLTAQAVVGHVGEDHVLLLWIANPEERPQAPQSAEFRFAALSGIYTFKSTNVQLEPASEGKWTCTLLPPFEMSHRQQRNFIRVEPISPMSIWYEPLYPDWYKSGTGLIVDYSGSGIRFVTDEFVHNQSIVRFSFDLPGHGTVSGIGQVVRKEFVQGESITSIRFLEMDPEVQKAIVSLSVAEQLRLAQEHPGQKRRFARVNVPDDITATLVSTDEDRSQTIHAAIVNLGIGGMQVTSRESVRHHTTYRAAFFLDGVRQPVIADCICVDQRKTDEMYHIHLEFSHLSPAHRQRLLDYVLQVQLRQLNDSEQPLTDAM